VWLPAIYCCGCGRAGWMTALEPGTDAVVLDGGEIREASVDRPELPRPFIDATNEYRGAVADGAELSAFDDEDGKRALMWFHTSMRTLSITGPSEEARAEGSSVPVLTYSDLGAEGYARDQVCLNCGEPDAVRYIGSRVVTQVSVMTIHGAKGMEVTHVSLMGVGKEFMPLRFRLKNLSEQDARAALQQERSLLYVAASRARDELVITTVGERSELLPEG